MKKLLIGSALVLSFGQAYAAESPKWDSLSASSQHIDANNENLSGFGISGSALLNDNVFAFGDISKTSDTNNGVDFDFDTLSLGLGYRVGISQNTDLFGRVSYEKFEAKASSRGRSNKADNNGYGLAVGVRSMVSDQIELLGSIGYLDIEEESEAELTVGAYYHFTDNFALGLNYNKIDHLKTTGISATLFF